MRFGGDAEIAEQFAGMAVHQARVEQAARRDIEKQAAGQALRGKCPQAGLAAGVFEIERQAAASRRRK
jgi:hypothetical protein